MLLPPYKIDLKYFQIYNIQLSRIREPSLRLQKHEHISPRHSQESRRSVQCCFETSYRDYCYK